MTGLTSEIPLSTPQGNAAQQYLNYKHYNCNPKKHSEKKGLTASWGNPAAHHQADRKNKSNTLPFRCCCQPA